MAPRWFVKEQARMVVLVVSLSVRVCVCAVVGGGCADKGKRAKPKINVPTTVGT